MGQNRGEPGNRGSGARDVRGQSSDAPHVRNWREDAWQYWTQGRTGGTLEDHLGDYPGGRWTVPPAAPEVAKPVVSEVSSPAPQGPEEPIAAPAESPAQVPSAAVAATEVNDGRPGESASEPGWGLPACHETLAQRITRLANSASSQSIGRPGTRDESVWIARVLENALNRLHEIHEEGRVHGAISPERLVVTRDEDAVLLDPEFETTEPAVTYTAPEALMVGEDEPLDPRSDVWSVGVCLFEALTWQRPYLDGRAAADLAFRRGAVPAPRALNGAVPRALSEVVQRAIDPNPAVRYATAGEFATDLRAARAGARPPLLTAAAAVTTSRPRVRSPLVVALAMVATSIAAALVMALTVLDEERHERARLAVDLRASRELVSASQRSLDTEILTRRGVTTRYSPDGKRLVALFENGSSASLCATPDGTPQGFTRLVGHERPINSAVFDGVGGRLLTASSDGTAALWNVHTGTRALQFLGHGDDVMSAEWSADGERIVTASLDGTARVWDADTARELHVLKNPAPVRMARFSPSGRHVLTLTSTGTVLIFDLATGDVLATIDGPPPPLL